MKQISVSAIVAFVLSVAVLGQETSSHPSFSRLAEMGQSVRVRMGLEPVNEPVPALRHQLQFGVIDLIPANAALAYNMALIQLLDVEIDSERMNTMKTWLDVPMDDLPATDARTFVNRFGMALQTASRGARHEHCDWQLPIREEGFALLLPHLSGLRDLTKILALRARLHISDGKYPEALEDIRTGLAMAHHIGNSSTLIESLVGISCTHVVLDRLEEWIGSPGSPSLYWALTELSATPMFSFRDAMRWEKSILYVHAPGLQNLDRRVITTHQYHEALAEVLDLAGQPEVKGITPDERKGALGAGLALAVYPRAREALLAQGISEETVETLPVAHVVTRYLLDRFERHRDNAFKWSAIPFPEARAGMMAAREALAQAMEDDPVGSMLPGILLPAVTHASTRFAEVDRRIAALRCIAALRLDLASTGEGFPPTLDHIQHVPIPDDPMTGNPFAYQAGPEGARLELPALPGEKPRRGRLYQLTAAN